MDAKRRAYLDWVEAELGILDAKIDELQARYQKAEAKGRIEADGVMDTLREQRDQLHEHLSELRTAGADAVDELKDAVTSSWQDLREGVEDAYRKLSEARS